MGGDGFLDHVTKQLAALPGVQAVTLGGFRAQGIHRDDSDWDMGIYYRGAFDPHVLRDLGWPAKPPRSAIGVVGYSTAVRA